MCGRFEFLLRVKISYYSNCVTEPLKVAVEEFATKNPFSELIDCKRCVIFEKSEEAAIGCTYFNYST